MCWNFGYRNIQPPLICVFFFRLWTKKDKQQDEGLIGEMKSIIFFFCVCVFVVGISDRFSLLVLSEGIG